MTRLLRAEALRFATIRTYWLLTAGTVVLIAGALCVTGEYRHKTLVPAVLITPLPYPAAGRQARHRGRRRAGLRLGRCPGSRPRCWCWPATPARPCSPGRRCCAAATFPRDCPLVRSG